MIKQLTIALGLLILSALFIEVIIPRQTTVLYENLTKRVISREHSRRSHWLLWLRLPGYALMAYLSFLTAQGNEVSSVILAALACLMAGVVAYCNSFSRIVEDIKSDRK